MFHPSEPRRVIGIRFSEEEKEILIEMAYSYALSKL